MHLYNESVAERVTRLERENAALRAALELALDFIDRGAEPVDWSDYERRKDFEAALQAVGIAPRAAGA